MLVQSRPSYATQNQKFGAELAISRPAERTLRGIRRNQIKWVRKYGEKEYKDYPAQSANTQIRALKSAFRKITKSIKDVKVTIQKGKDTKVRGDLILGFEYNGQKYDGGTLAPGKTMPDEFRGIGTNPNNKSAVLYSVNYLLERLADAIPVVNRENITTKEYFAMLDHPFMNDIESAKSIDEAKAALKPHFPELPRKRKN